jgi:hypothetical protein
MHQLQTHVPIPVFLFASPVYWPDADKRQALFSEVQKAMGLADADRWRVCCIEDAEGVDIAVKEGGTSPCVVVALSGGIQPWMREVCRERQQIGLFNAYLPEALPVELSGKLMHANAHPASTDFFAACREAGKGIHWFSSLAEVGEAAGAWQAVARLKRARFLKIGETEPWVINSCRDPETIAQRIGCEVIPLDREVLYAEVETVTEEEAKAEAAQWRERSGALVGIDHEDIFKATRITVAMRNLMARHEADGLSMACFAMIGDLDTTSCLALSALNDSASAIGACEGDLDAALTLFLLKAMGADFVWIANPIFHPDHTIDLAHCTAPTCACGKALPYKLMRHHESGKGVSPEVELPGGEVASAVRIGIQAGRIVCHVGRTERQPKLPACHTQVRLHVESTPRVLETLPGTHLVLSYGDFARRMTLAAEALGLESAVSCNVS